MNASMAWRWALRTTAAATLLAAAAACTAATDDGGGGGSGSGAQDGAGSSTSPAQPAGSASTSTPEYKVSCNGEVTKTQGLAISETVGIRCVDAPPDSGQRCGDPCKAQDVAFAYQPPLHRCGTSDVYVWDGTACAAHPTQTNAGAMRCKGADCPELFKTKDACAAAYAHCSGR